MEYILTTDKLTKAYKQHKAANEVSLHIRKGEVYGLIGRNGAGKTTVLKMICGLATPTSGSFTFQGKTGAELVSVKNRIGALIETPGLFLKMTAFQNVKLKCLACGRNDDAYVQSLLEQVGLGNVGKKLVQNFSLGMKQRLGIALALIGDPDFIVLDEPIVIPAALPRLPMLLTMWLCVSAPSRAASAIPCAPAMMPSAAPRSWVRATPFPWI